MIINYDKIKKDFFINYAKNLYRIAISPNQEFLVSFGQDGSIFIFETPKKIKKIGKSNEILDEIFKYCYELGKNVSLENTLNEIAVKFGLKNLNTNENMKSVILDEKIGKNKYGINGIPFFIFPNDEVIEGAESPENFLSALEKSIM